MDLNVVLVQYGPYVFILYLFVTDVIPRIFPEFTKVISKRISTEDRLFQLLEKNGDVGTALAASLTKLESTLNSVNIAVQTLSQRIDVVETTLHGANSVIAKLIKE